MEFQETTLDLKLMRFWENSGNNSGKKFRK
jgi:hypothetical protein